MMQGAGVKCIGYVDTDYASRDIEKEVKSDIDKCVSNFPSINGIMFDLMSQKEGQESYYKELSDYAKSKITNALTV
jgi:hypothetical protein